MTKARPRNNDQQNEHTIIVPDTQDVPNQIEENVRSSVRDLFFLMAKEQRKPAKEKADFSSYGSKFI